MSWRWRVQAPFTMQDFPELELLEGERDREQLCFEALERFTLNWRYFLIGVVLFLGSNRLDDFISTLPVPKLMITVPLFVLLAYSMIRFATFPVRRQLQRRIREALNRRGIRVCMT